MKENNEKIAVVEQKEKAYTLRELCDEDLYTVLAIVGAVIPDDAKDTFTQMVNGEKSVKEVGGMVAFDMTRLILKNFKTVKDDVYAFLSDLSGIPAAQIARMPFGTTPMMLKEVFDDAKNASFFMEFSKLL